MKLKERIDANVGSEDKAVSSSSSSGNDIKDPDNTESHDARTSGDSKKD